MNLEVSLLPFPRARNNCETVKFLLFNCIVWNNFKTCRHMQPCDKSWCMDKAPFGEVMPKRLGITVEKIRECNQSAQDKPPNGFHLINLFEFH